MNAKGLRRGPRGIKRDWQWKCHCRDVEINGALRPLHINTRQSRKDSPNLHGSNVIYSGYRVRTQAD